jgi:hypothetical protein
LVSTGALGKMLGINFIITCFDREVYWPYLKDIILSYKEIIPHIALCYNGSDNGFPCNFRTVNLGQQIGDGQLIAGGYHFLKRNGIDNWVKLSVDSWLCKEQVILDLFRLMNKNKYHYAGNVWKRDPGAYSTDVIFADSLFMRVFTESFKPRQDLILEKYACGIAREIGGVYIIPERVERINDDETRYSVPELGWTMEHELQRNIDFAKQYAI